jgi:endonuclease I
MNISRCICRTILYMNVSLLLFRGVSTIRTDPLLTLCEPVRMRSYLEYEILKSYKPLSYGIAKDILHKKIQKNDLYGDNSQSTNVEHIFPQSFFKNDTRKSQMKSDLHHLYLCNIKLNTYRQNFKYVDSSTAKVDDKIRILDMKGEIISNETELFTKRGYLMVTNKNSKTFIPAENSRGKIARALSFFAIKYNYLDVLENVINIKTLIEWNLKDPVDNDEYLKNIIIYHYQGDLNPFVINSDLITYCFADKCNIDQELLRKKRTSNVDSLYTIDYLLNEIKKLENDKSEMKSLLLKKWSP